MVYEGIRGPSHVNPADNQFGLGLARSLTPEIDGPKAEDRTEGESQPWAAAQGQRAVSNPRRSCGGEWECCFCSGPRMPLFHQSSSVATVHIPAGKLISARD